MSDQTDTPTHDPFAPTEASRKPADPGDIGQGQTEVPAGPAAEPNHQPAPPPAQAAHPGEPLQPQANSPAAPQPPATSSSSSEESLVDEAHLVENVSEDPHEADAKKALDQSGLLVELLTKMIEIGASDLHISAGNPPLFRLHGSLQRTEHEVLKPADIQRMIYAILTQRQREIFEDELELDFSYSLPGTARYRVNIYRQRDAMGAAFRLIPFEIKTLEELGMPPQVKQFAELPRGMVLVTGPTGSGKSTTLAALIDIVNSETPAHIMSVEDPIEFLHKHKQSAVHQREIGSDTRSFSIALKHALRQDPDVILVGEMRDLETISMALTAAETGHLVFATLHTNSAPGSIDRIIDVFPPHQQQQIRIQLAATLQGVVTQTLLPTLDGSGRAVAAEVLVATPAIANLIREAKTHQIFSAMQAGGSQGMQTMDKALAQLVNTGRVKREIAEERCHDRDNFNQLLKSI